MSGEAPVYIFSAVTIAMWVATLAWSFSHEQRNLRWYNVTVLIAATFAWWLGENTAIRLGKYQYSAFFPSSLVLPFGGAPHPDTDWLWKGLHKLTVLTKIPTVTCDPAQSIPSTPGGALAQSSWNIPFPIVALEACLVFAFLRLSFFRLRNKGFWAAVAAACLSAVLMVTLAAILDPVVSTHTWCGLGDDPLHRHGLLKFEIWHWFSNETYAGYWFGVPTVNYIAWLIGMGAFSFLVRLDDDGPNGLIRRYEHWWQYAWAIVRLLVMLFLIQIPAKIGMDVVLVRVRGWLPAAIRPSAEVWELGWVLFLLCVFIAVVWWYGRVHPDPRREWVCTAPPVVVLLLCLLALILEWGGWLNIVWVVAFVVTMMILGLPFIMKYLPEKWRDVLLADV